MVVVRKPGTGEEVEGLKKLLRGVDGVVEKGGGGWDGVRVVVGFAGGMVGVARGEVVEGLKEGVGGGDEVKEGVGEWGGGKEEGVEIRIRVKEEVMGEEMGVELENQRGMGVEMGKEIGEEEWERICWEEGGWEWVDGEVVGGERTGEHRGMLEPNKILLVVAMLPGVFHHTRAGVVGFHSVISMETDHCAATSRTNRSRTAERSARNKRLGGRRWRRACIRRLGYR